MEELKKTLYKSDLNKICRVCLKQKPRLAPLVTNIKDVASNEDSMTLIDILLKITIKQV